MSVNLCQQDPSSPYICNYLSDNLFCHLGHCFAETASCWLTLFHLWYSWDLLGSGEITLGSSWFKDLDDFCIIFFPACLYFALLCCKEYPLVSAAS